MRQGINAQRRRSTATSIVTFAAAAALGAAGQVHAQTNMLLNPSFEGGNGNDMPGWGDFSNAYASNNGNEGVYDRTGTGTGVGKLFGPFFNNPNASGFYQQLDATPGVPYQFHVYSYQKTGDDLTSGTADNFVLERVTFFDAGGNELTDAGQNVRILDATFPKDQWIDNPNAIATAPANAAYVGAYILFIQPQLAGGAGFFDDASLTAVPIWSVDSDGNWSNPSNWGPGGVPNSVGAMAILGPKISINHTVTVDGPNTVGTLVFDNAHSYTLAGPGPLTLQTSGGRAVIDVKTGSHVVNTSVSAASPVTIQLETAGSNLTFGSAGKLDLHGQNLVIDYAAGAASPAASLVTSLQTGRNGGAWNGSGITSSNAAADASHAIALGWAEASDLLGLSGTATATWNGATVDASSILVKPTYYGDLNLDGKVNADDYALIDRALAAHLPAKWINGDVNYDGTINGQDYALMDAAFMHQGGVLSAETLAGREATFGPGYSALLAAAVPEPATAGIALMTAAVAAAGRRRR